MCMSENINVTIQHQIVIKSNSVKLKEKNITVGEQQSTIITFLIICYYKI